VAYIIAEIGFNHAGNMDIAANMIRAAASSGANAVKFQTFRAADIVLPSSPHYDVIKNGEMDLLQHIELKKVADGCNVDFLSTPFSLQAVELLEKVEVPAFKVASMDCTNKLLLSHIAQTKKPVYLSTGMATLDEISETLRYLEEQKSGPVTLMHCLSLYPAKAEDLNLSIIPFMKKTFECPVGYSDHYPGTMGCLAAAMTGAEVIETHFTLNSLEEGGDHSHSVEPDSLKQLVADIRVVTAMRGHYQTMLNRTDRTFAKEYRRGLYAAEPLSAGAQIKETDFLFCRPTSDLSPGDMMWLPGNMLNHDIDQYMPVKKHFIRE